MPSDLGDKPQHIATHHDNDSSPSSSSTVRKRRKKKKERKNERKTVIRLIDTYARYLRPNDTVRISFSVSAPLPNMDGFFSVRENDVARTRRLVSAAKLDLRLRRLRSR